MMMIKKNHTSSLRMSNRFEQEVVASDTYELVTDLFCHLLECAYMYYVLMYKGLALHSGALNRSFKNLQGAINTLYRHARGGGFTRRSLKQTMVDNEKILWGWKFTFPPSFFSSAFRAPPPLGFDLESFESFLVFFDFFFESRSRLESEELELESLLESLLELELELLAFLFFLSWTFRVW